MIVLGCRVNHHTTPQARFIRHSGRGGQRQVAPSAIPREYHLAVVGRECVEVIDDPARCGHGIFMGSREGVLRRQTVIDRHDRAPRFRGQQQAKGMMGIEVADRPAAAVKINHQRALTRAVVHPCAECVPLQRELQRTGVELRQWGVLPRQSIHAPVVPAVRKRFESISERCHT